MNSLPISLPAYRGAEVLSLDVAPVPVAESRGVFSGLARFLKSHPILFLLLLTPGIPEYLSASSNLTVLIILPPLFLVTGKLVLLLPLLFLAANVALYGSGVILIREAVVRWKKGWASVFLLGVAYGILEEGIDLWTLFYSKASPVGNLGYYGHWLGVNWVWTMGLLIFHSVYSIGLPIFLFGLVFPEMKSKSLVTGRKLATVVGCLILDSIFLYMFVSGVYSPYSPGGGLILFSGLVVTILVIVARRLPANFLSARSGEPAWSSFRFAFVGAFLFPATLLVGGFAASANAPPEIPFVLDLVLAMIILTRAYKAMGNVKNQEQKVALGIGLIFPIAVFGIFASVGLANFLVVIGDLLYIVFARRLWRKWRVWTPQTNEIQTTLQGTEGPVYPNFP